MKKIVFSSLFILLLGSSLFAQQLPKKNYHSLWYFHPFSIDLTVGLWTPVGKLSHYCLPSAQFGAGLGLMVSKRMRFQYWIIPILLNQKNSIQLKVNDSIVDFKKNQLGSSIGGWLSYTFYQNKIVSTEILTGITWENLPTNILKANKKDTISISALGLSIGINSWINTFQGLNFGIRAIYTYSTYNKSEYLANSIGANSFTFSLVYRFPKRNQKFKKWY